MRFRSIILFLFLVPTIIWGEDSIPASNRVGMKLSPSLYFNSYTLDNPALAGYTRTFSLIDMNLSVSIEKNKNELPQLGTGKQIAGFDADAQLTLKNKDYIWGSAYYKNGKKEDVQWNESADFFKLYPYVSLDTIGGDLKYEQYFFQGGYSKQYRHYSWGISAGFKEIQEYRDKDPRPKNTSSDLHLDLAGSRKVFFNYVIAADLHLEKYKQTNDVKFYSEKGGYPIYNALGLGLVNNRFWGNSAMSYYSGSTYGGSLTLIPQNLSGWSASLMYNQSDLNKRITVPSSIDLNRTITRNASAGLGYLKRSQNKNYGINSSFDYNKRLGYESIVGDVVGGSYQIIGENQPYKSEYKQLSVKGLYEKTGNTSWSVQPEFSAGQLNINYQVPARSMEVSFWQPQLKTSFYHIFGKSSIKINLNCAYYNTFNNKLDITNQTSENKDYKQSTLYAYSSLTSSYTNLLLNAKYHYFYNKNMGVYFQMSGEQRWYEQQLSNSIMIFTALGFIF